MLFELQLQIDRLELHEVPDQQARARKQHQRQRDFAHDQRASQLAAPEATDDAAARILERLGHVLPGRLQRRHQPEDDGREYGHAEAERQHGNAHADDGLGRKQALWHQAFDGLDAHVGERTSEHPTTDGKHETLDEQLANQQPAAGAKRCSDRHFLLARGRAGQQHVGGVWYTRSAAARQPPQTTYRASSGTA